MSGLITWHVTLAIILGILSFIFAEPKQAMSLGMGAVVSIANLVALGWSWHRIFSKKTVALAAGVIVFKYAILGLIIYVIVKDRRADLLWFVSGLSTFIPAILFYAFQTRRFVK